VTANALATDAPKPPTFWEALAYWLKLGFISFGGPAGQIAIMHEDLVERKRWISEKRFLHALNYCTKPGVASLPADFLCCHLCSF